MCIISLAVQKVAGTQILTGVDAKRKRQIVVYGNTVDNNHDGNAMILPIPHPESIEFINLSDYKNIFNDCSMCFASQFDARSVRSLQSYGTNSKEGPGERKQSFLFREALG